MRQLRDYQVEMLDRLEKAWQRWRSVMVQMPTGTGKTYLMAEIIRSITDNPSPFGGGSNCQGGVLIVAHRRELLDQIRGTVRHFGIDMEENHIVVESIQKLSRDAEGINPSLVIVDEAHHALAKSYRWMWEQWPKARFLGLTATPCRLNNAPFTDLFDTLLQSYSIQGFIDRGWLSDFEYVSASPESAELRRVAALRKRGVDGDYQAKELVTVMDVPESIAHLYDTYHQFADGKNGCYGVINGSKVTCMPRFKKIVRLEDQSGYFAAGIYGGKQDDIYVEYASLIDRKGVDLKLRLFRDVKWKNGYFYSCYKRPGYKEDDYFWSVYWDPKGNCYYDYDPEFQMVGGVEVACASEHARPDTLCYKLRQSTGMVSPRFKVHDIFYNRSVIVARDYLIVKKDHNHAYQICAFLSDSVLVRQESDHGFQQIFMDGRKGECFRRIPPDAKRSILQVQQLGLKRA